LDRDHPHLPAPVQRLARRGVPQGHVHPRRPARGRGAPRCEGAIMSQALSEPLAGHLQPRSRSTPSLEEFAGAYVAAGATPAARKCRRIGVARFMAVFGDLTGWAEASIAARRAVRTEVMSFAAHAIVRCHLPVDVDFVVASGCHWGIYIRDAYPAQAAEFDQQAASLGFCATETGRMWSYLARICIITGTAPDQLAAAQYQQARTALHEAVI